MNPKMVPTAAGEPVSEISTSTGSNEPTASHHGSQLHCERCQIDDLKSCMEGKSPTFVPYRRSMTADPAARGDGHCVLFDSGDQVR